MPGQHPPFPEVDGYKLNKRMLPEYSWSSILGSTVILSPNTWLTRLLDYSQNLVAIN